VLTLVTDDSRDRHVRRGPVEPERVRSRAEDDGVGDQAVNSGDGERAVLVVDRRPDLGNVAIATHPLITGAVHVDVGVTVAEGGTEGQRVVRPASAATGQSEVSLDR